MNPNHLPNPDLPTSIEHLLRQLPESGAVTAHALFEHLQPLQVPLEELVTDLCEHAYCELALEFLQVCKDRNMDPDSGHFKGWLTIKSNLPGYLLTVFSERFEQDRQDGVVLMLPDRSAGLIARLEKERQLRINPVLPVETQLPDPGNGLVAPDQSE